MTQTLKALGLALAATLAIGAIVAQAASANVEHSYQFTNGGKFFTSKLIDHPGVPGSAEHVFRISESAEMKCASAIGTGTGGASEKEDMIALTMTYSECKVAGMAATVTNGEGVGKKNCRTTVDSDTTEDPYTGGESAPFEISCDAGQAIKISVAGCTVSIGAQGPIHGVHLENEGKEPTGIEATIHTSGLKYTSAGFTCGLIGIPPSGINGTTLANYTMTAYKDSAHKEQVGMHITTP